jgi:hypothetical protein
MFAPTLMDVLAGLVYKGQLPHPQYLDIAQRFASLRGYGLLPRGREGRAQELSLHEIANAILGLAAYSPHWAGHVALILSKLQPTNQEHAMYNGARTLQGAIVKLLDPAHVVVGLQSPGTVMLRILDQRSRTCCARLRV